MKGEQMNVLITGGGGSLGQAFARRLYKEHKVTLLDNNEWSLAKCTLPVEKLLMDFSEWKFNEHPCDILIHLAAYKHVEMGEENPQAFIENNIIKTMKLFKEAAMFDVDTLFVSTDKAVEPISTYGFTKALGEDLAESHNFSVARLGNILASSGSVIPKWEAAIEAKQPIVITDERMSRYVIEDFEAVDQIWDMFRAGKKLIIPQCREIRMLDMLTDVLKRHDLTIHDVTVDIVGMRRGEKLREVLEWPKS